jgi:hypothetical protein
MRGARGACVMIAIAMSTACGRVDFDASDPFDGFRDGCALMLHMDEPAWTDAAGEVVDDCGGNDGTATGSATTVPDGVRGRAGRFPAGTCVELGDAAAFDATSALTISTWVLSMAFDDVGPFGILSKRNDFTASPEYAMFVGSANDVYVDIGAGNQRIWSTTSLSNGTWTQITSVYDGTLAGAMRERIYINGVSDTPDGEDEAAITPMGQPLYVGCVKHQDGDTAMNTGFDGELDEVAVWTRALGASEVAAWYAATAPAR